MHCRHRQEQNNTNLEVGGFGRINDPTLRDPYVQKFSLGFEHTLSAQLRLSSDFVHTLGLFENRVQNVNPRIGAICNPAFPGSTLRHRGVSAVQAPVTLSIRRFVAAGLGAGRLEQINMFTLDESVAILTVGRRRSDIVDRSAFYNRELCPLEFTEPGAASPHASYSGNGIATTAEQQFGLKNSARRGLTKGIASFF